LKLPRHLGGAIARDPLERAGITAKAGNVGGRYLQVVVFEICRAIKHLLESGSGNLGTDTIRIRIKVKVYTLGYYFNVPIWQGIVGRCGVVSHTISKPESEKGFHRHVVWKVSGIA